MALDKFDFLQARPWFTGIWVDQRAGGEIVVSVSATPDESEASLLRLLPSGASLRFAKLDFPRSELDAFRGQIEPFLSGDGAFDAGFRGLWIDPVTGLVRLNIEEGSSEAISLLGELAASPMLAISYARFGGLTSCTRYDCADPIKGGIDIDNSFSNCTAGFRGRPVSGTPTSKYLITAGHCFKGTPWKHGLAGGDLLGNDYIEWFQNGSFADAGIIKIDPTTPLGTSPANLVYNASPTVFQQITGFLSEANMSVGTTICRAGTISGYFCGSVTATNLSAPVGGGITLYHQWEMSGHVVKGDSGGPVGNGSYAGGIMAYSYQGPTPPGYWYTGYGTMPQIILKGWKPCYNASCT